MNESFEQKLNNIEVVPPEIPNVEVRDKESIIEASTKASPVNVDNSSNIRENEIENNLPPLSAAQVKNFSETFKSENTDPNKSGIWLYTLKSKNRNQAPN